jgi:para-aminobenzoate synthetase/4-amino-4-deoxychorismate lyase
VPAEDRLPPTLLLQASSAANRWLAFEQPLAILAAHRLEEVTEVVARATEAARQGLWAAGFLTYEAAPAFDPAFVTRAAGALPLVWFGLFEKPRRVALEELPFTGASPRHAEWQPTLGARKFAHRVERVHAAVARGDTYQVNLTFRLRSRGVDDAWPLFRRLAAGRARGHGAWVDLGEHQLCSVSPELFFSLDGERLTARPMKGTARRGPTTATDRAQVRRLAASPKNRAENLMIVDMVRNDLGRVARPGSVETLRLFEVERHPGVLQMTSTVSARTRAGLPEILAALFPCASITGAPKVRTMELIAELEDDPRGIYTGAIGYLAPGRRAEFNVAIRTLHLDRQRGVAEYGTGAGVVWDSVAAQEYEECRIKAWVVTEPGGPVTLFETLLWDSAAGGYWLLDRHLDRLLDSAFYFGLPCDREEVLAELERCVGELAPGRWRVRLELAAPGGPEAVASPLDEVSAPWRVALAAAPVDAGEPLLHHKTTDRTVYDQARALAPDVDDVLLYNREGELTESTVANLVLRRAGRWVTPAAECGLLPGTLRAELLARGVLEEARLRREDLAAADEVWLIRLPTASSNSTDSGHRRRP